jgi:HK97 gp10 family phage protein
MRWVGIQEVKRRLQTLEPKVRNKCLRKGMRPAIKIMLNRARQLAPKGKSRTFVAHKGYSPIQHRGGLLKRAIKIVSGRSRKGVRISVMWKRGADNDAYYGAFVNEGTKKIRAQKFLEQAFRQTARQVQSTAITSILQEIESVV